MAATSPRRALPFMASTASGKSRTMVSRRMSKSISNHPHGARATTHNSKKPLRRSEEHTSELQSLRHLVCRLLLGKQENTTEIQSLRHCVCRLRLERRYELRS